MANNQYDVVIVGGGISGTALLFMLSRYTNLKRIALIEKKEQVAAVNSHGRNNSQTLHCGDIETNYSLDKALQVQSSANMLVQYTKQFGNNAALLHKYPKMVLGVGHTECSTLRERYTTFAPHYPGMQLLEKDEITRIEPNITKKRKQEVVALGVLNDFSAVNFQHVATSFVHNTTQNKKCHTDILLGTHIKKIQKQGDSFNLTTSQGHISAKFVIVSAGGHSLLFAQQMGYGHEYACLPVAGSFYYIPQLLNGKVYTVQNPCLPFAAIHGDPDILVPNKTRLGPTALLLPMLERYNYHTIVDFFKVFNLDKAVLKTMWNLLKVRDVRRYLIKNILFEIPLIRRRLFLKDAQKIIPSLRLDDLSFASGIGGIRPVMIDKKKSELLLGEAKIDPGNGIIFNMTPSPGATSCLFNAEKDLHSIAAYLHCTVNTDAIQSELK